MIKLIFEVVPGKFTTSPYVGLKFDREWPAVPREGEHVAIDLGKDKAALTGNVVAVLWFQGPSGNVYAVVRIR
jgi:hypothetical protein